MLGLQGGFLCLVHGHEQIGTQTIGKAAGEVCAQLGRELAVRHGILIEHSGVVQHTGGGPVTVVGQEGDGQICAAILGGEHHEALHIDAVFIGGVQLGLLALGEGDADLHVAGGPGRQRHGLVAGNGDIQRLVVAAHVGLAVLLQHGGGHGDDGHVILGGVLAHVPGVEGQVVAAVLGNIVPQIQHGLGVAVLVGIGVEHHIAGGGGGHQGLGVEVGRLQNTADVVLGEFGVCRGVGKGGMGGIQPGIQHGDGHALTGELIGGQRHLQGLRIGLLHGGQGVGACHEGTADALGVLDGLQILPGGPQGEAVEEHGIGIGMIHLLLPQRAAQAGLHRGLTAQQGLLDLGGGLFGWSCAPLDYKRRRRISSTMDSMASGARLHRRRLPSLAIRMNSSRTSTFR